MQTVKGHNTSLHAAIGGRVLHNVLTVQHDRSSRHGTVSLLNVSTIRKDLIGQRRIARILNEHVNQILGQKNLVINGSLLACRIAIACMESVHFWALGFQDLFINHSVKYKIEFIVVI